jgi:dTDP-4-dehydrorhamnose 3,5-epimerase
VIEGTIRDICIDLDEGEVFTFDMKAGDVLWVPRGYAHGFCSLDDSIVMYLLDNAYKPEAGLGVNPFCTQLNLDWGHPYPMAIARDLSHPSWSDRFESL